MLDGLSGGEDAEAAVAAPARCRLYRNLKVAVGQSQKVHEAGRAKAGKLPALKAGDFGLAGIQRTASFFRAMAG